MKKALGVIIFSLPFLLLGGISIYNTILIIGLVAMLKIIAIIIFSLAFIIACFSIGYNLVSNK